MENKENELVAEVEKVEKLEEDKQTESLAKTDSVDKEKEGFLRYFDFRIISLFVLGILLGFAIKTQATKTIVTGANDPKLEKTRGDYMLSKMRQQTVEPDVTEEGATGVEDPSVVSPEETTVDTNTETTIEE